MKQLKASLDREIYGKVEKASGKLQRETAFVSDPKFQKVPEEILKVASHFKEEYAKRPFPSVFDEFILKLHEIWNKGANAQLQKEKGKLLGSIEVLRGRIKRTNSLSQFQPEKNSRGSSRNKSSMNF